MQLKKLLVALVSLWFSACGINSLPKSIDAAQIAEPIQAQRFVLNDGFQVSLEPPIGFNLTPEHYGFVQPESFSRIKVYEIEVPYQKYLASLTKENLALIKLQLVKQQKTNVANATCHLIELKQIVAGTVFDKQLLICGDELSSVVVEASYPESANKIHRQAIYKSVNSLLVNVENKLRLFTGLPFKLTDTPEYNISKRFRNSLVMLPLSDSSGKSSVVISHGASENTTINQLAEFLISSGSSPENIEILTNEEAKLDKIPALATTAYVNVAGETYWMKQVLSYQDNRFLLVQTRAPKIDKEITNQKLENLLRHFEFK
jgi:hypothetical protein